MRVRLRVMWLGLGWLGLVAALAALPLVIAGTAEVAVARGAVVAVLPLVRLRLRLRLGVRVGVRVRVRVRVRISARSSVVAVPPCMHELWRRARARARARVRVGVG